MRLPALADVIAGSVVAARADGAKPLRVGQGPEARRGCRAGASFALAVEADAAIGRQKYRNPPRSGHDRARYQAGAVRVRTSYCVNRAIGRPARPMITSPPASTSASKRDRVGLGVMNVHER